MAPGRLIARLLLTTALSTAVIEALPPTNVLPITGSLSKPYLQLAAIHDPWSPHGNDTNHSPMPIREFAKQNGSGFITGGTPLTHL